MSGAIRKLYRNTLFRSSLLGALLFVLSLFAALGYVYYAVVASELNKIDRSISLEIKEFREEYNRAGTLAIDLARTSGRIPIRASTDDMLYRRIYSEAGLQAIGQASLLRGLSYERLYVLQTSEGVIGNLGLLAEQNEGILFDLSLIHI